MNRRTSSIVVASLFAVLSTGATATTTGECQGYIKPTLYNKTIAADFKNPKDDAALMSKLDEAWDKLYVAKLADASQKIADYTTKLTQVQNGGKLIDSTGTVYSDLMNSAAGVQSCIASIGK